MFFLKVCLIRMYNFNGTEVTFPHLTFTAAWFVASLLSFLYSFNHYRCNTGRFSSG